MSAVCLNEWTARRHMSPDPPPDGLSAGHQGSILGMEINLVVLAYKSHFSAKVIISYN